MKPKKVTREEARKVEAAVTGAGGAQAPGFRFVEEDPIVIEPPNLYRQRMAEGARKGAEKKRNLPFTPEAVAARMARPYEVRPIEVVDFQSYLWRNLEGFIDQLWGWKELPDGRINDSPFIPWRKQREIIRSVRDHRLTAVHSGNGIGKTKVVAAICIGFLESHTPSYVVTTSAGWRELEKVLWPEIRHLFYTSALPLGAEPLTLEWSPGGKGMPHTERWKMVAVASKDKNNFAGFHNKRVLAVGDEADGLTSDVVQAMQGNALGEHDRILLTGNPHTPDGEFKRCCASSDWNTIHISCFMHPNIRQQREVIPGCVTQTWINLMREELGEGSPAWMARVEGLFPDLDQSVLIPWAWLVAAAARWNEAEDFGGGVPAYDPAYGVLGIDVADSPTGDRTVFFLRDNHAVRELEEYRGLDAMGVVAAMIAFLVKVGGCRKIGIDSIGVGGGVVDRAKELMRDGVLTSLGVEVLEGVCASERAFRPERFVILRDECAWMLKDLFDPQYGYMINPKLLNRVSELSIPKLVPHSSGKTKLESKDDIKERMRKMKRAAKSCDVFDAGAISCSPTILMRRAAGAVSISQFGIGIR